MKTIKRPEKGVLVSTKSVLLLSDHFADHLRFDGDDDTSRPVVRLPRDRWEDMGRPNKITVTIEPGIQMGEARL